LVEFQLQIKGGLLLEEVSKIGVSNILAELLTKGTKNKTAEELENAIESLGATISATADAESITIAGSTLAKTTIKP
jgi:zinc protease